MLKSLLRHSAITVIAFVLVFLFAFTAYKMPFMSPIAEAIKDFDMTDVYYQILQDTADEDEEYSEEVSIVDISDLYSRRDLAEALQKIENCEPKVIGVDVVFEGLKEDSIGDDMIAEVALSNDNIVFSYKLLDYVNDSIGHATTVHSFFAQEEGNVTEGFTNMPRNLYGGIKRKLTLGERAEGKDVPSFIAMTVAMYEGRKIDKVSTKELGINFTPRRYHIISPDSIAAHPEYIKGKVVLFGAMREEYDMHYTPLGKIAGTELLAYAIETLMDQSEVVKVNPWVTAIVLFLIVLVTQIIFSRYAKFAQRRSNRVLRIILSASFIKGYLMFFWIGLWMWLAFVLFYMKNFTIDMGMALAAMALLGFAQSIYDEIIVTLIQKQDGK